MYPKKSVYTLVHELAAQLAPVYTDQSRALQYAWWTLECVTKQSHAKLLTHDGIALTSAQEKEVARWVEQLVEHEEPIQYLIGTVPFAGLELEVAHPILIPRPETEEWVMHIIEQLRTHNLTQERLRVLDMATGSGCIAIALAHALPNAIIHAVDLNPDALKLAQKNTQRLGLTNISYLESDFFSVFPASARYDLIVSNPPYVSFDEWKELSSSVKAWEDVNALVADDEGFACIEHIVEYAQQFLDHTGVLSSCPVPQLAIEIGHAQGEQSKELMEHHNYHDVQLFTDLAGKDRVVFGKKR